VKKIIYIAAGGTGGHINAALSLGEVFSSDYDVRYLSGTRYLDYQLFNNKQCTHLVSKPLRTKNPITLFLNISFNLIVFIKIMLSYVNIRPAFLLGAGGYICGPTLLAGKLLGIPIFIVEQNAVMGMTNKILSKFADKIFTNFEKTKGIANLKNVIVSGNPIRSTIKSSINTLIENDGVNILIFGGSLGASQLNEAIEGLVQIWDGSQLNILHQVGRNNINNFEVTNKKINYKQLEYIDDMNEKYNWCNVIISRAGASTVSELRVVKRPTIIVPFPQATDNHQYFNAMELKKEDGFLVEILDQSKKGKDLTMDIKNSLLNIIKNNLVYQNENKAENASEMIKKEIEIYVRN